MSGPPQPAGDDAPAPTNAELQARLQELQARNEELEAFALTVAHDLKSPINVIIGFADVLASAEAPLSAEELRQYHQLMAERGRAALKIIDGFLLLAGVDRETVEAIPLDMAGIVTTACDHLAEMINSSGAELILPGEPWPVALGHAPWVVEVWVNYLSNAIKYGGQPPRLELGADAPAGGAVRFWVQDNGPGLTPAEQARLFAPFVRLNRSREGHGLGLSIVRRIVERLGGQVGLESQPGQGSRFSFSLPVEED